MPRNIAASRCGCYASREGFVARQLTRNNSLRRAARIVCAPGDRMLRPRRIALAAELAQEIAATLPPSAETTSVITGIYRFAVAAEASVVELDNLLFKLNGRAD